MRHKLKDIDVENKQAVCAVCGPVKVRLRGRYTNASWRCCEQERFREKTREQKRIRKERLQLSHDFSISDYNTMLLAQDGKCAICKNPPDKKRLSIDHCHITGEVRGLLCNSCNLALGFAQDNQDILRDAADYLENYNRSHLKVV